MAETDWTIPTLEKHFRSLFEEWDKRIKNEIECLKELSLERMRRYDERISAQQVAAEKADEVLQRWQESANEWRGALSDNNANLLGRTEYEAKHQSLLERMDSISKIIDGINGRLAILEGRSSGIGSSLNVIIAVVSLLISITVGVTAVIHPYTAHL